MVGFQGLSLSEGLSACVDTSVINNSMFCCSFNGHQLQFERSKIRKGFEVLLYCTLSSLSHSCGFIEENIVTYRAYDVLHQRA